VQAPSAKLGGVLAALHRWTRFPERRDEPELLDLNEGAPAEVRESLDDLARIQRWLGGRAMLRRFVFPFLEQARDRAPLRVLDVGAGSGATAIEVARWARKKDLDVRIAAADLNRRHLSIAREAVRGYPEIQLVASDALAPPFAARGFDVVLSTLFLHHFSPERLKQLIPRLAALSRGRLALNDLMRDRAAAAAFTLLSPVFARSRLTRHDGRVSIRRSYTPEELQAILKDSGVQRPRLAVHGLYYRMTAVIDAAKQT